MEWPPPAEAWPPIVPRRWSITILVVRRRPRSPMLEQGPPTSRQPLPTASPTLPAVPLPPPVPSLPPAVFKKDSDASNVSTAPTPLRPLRCTTGRRMARIGRLARGPALQQQHQPRDLVNDQVSNNYNRLRRRPQAAYLQVERHRPTWKLLILDLLEVSALA